MPQKAISNYLSGNFCQSMSWWETPDVCIAGWNELGKWTNKTCKIRSSLCSFGAVCSNHCKKTTVWRLRKLKCGGSVEFKLASISWQILKMTATLLIMSASWHKQYLARLSLTKMSSVIGWFLVTCPWSNSNVSPQLLPAHRLCLFLLYKYITKHLMYGPSGN